MLLEMRLNFVHLFRVPVLSCSTKKEILSAVLSSNGLCSLVPSGAHGVLAYQDTTPGELM